LIFVTFNAAFALLLISAAWIVVGLTLALIVKTTLKMSAVFFIGLPPYRCVVPQALL
jgi:hypothetical protein